MLRGGEAFDTMYTTMRVPVPERVKFPLFFVLTFFWILFSNPPAFLLVVFVYAAFRFTARKKRGHGPIRGFLYFLLSVFHAAFFILFCVILLASVGISSVIAMSVQKTFVSAEICVLSTACFVLFARAKLRGGSFSLFVFTGILTFSNFLVLTSLSMRTEENYSRIFSEEGLRPVVLSADKKNPRLYTKLKKFPLMEGAATQMASDKNEKFLYVTAHTSEGNKKKKKALFRISLADPHSMRALAAYDLRELALDEESGRLFVCDRSARKVLVVSMEAFKVQSNINIAGDMKKNARRRDPSWILKSAFSPESVLVSRRNNRLLVTLEGGYLLSYALDTLAFKDFTALPCLPVHMRLSADGEKIYMGCGPIPPGKKNGLFVMDARSLKIVRRAGRFWFCRGMALSRKKPVLYYVDIFQGKLRTLRLPDLSVLDEAAIDDGVREVEEDPELPFLYVGNFTKGYVYVVDAKTKKVLRKMFTGLQVRHIYITPKTHRILVASNYGVFEILREKLPR